MKHLFLLSLLVSLTFTIASCKDGGETLVVNQGGEDGGGTSIVDSTGENEWLLGDWYMVGSNDSIGKKVIFTETTITYIWYSPDYAPNPYVLSDNIVYEIVSDWKMRLTGIPNNGAIRSHITDFTYIEDILTIYYFHPSLQTGCSNDENSLDCFFGTINLVRSYTNEN